MNELQVDRGRVEYTGRGLLQDAQEAMRGNIVRGLVELITNADDAYAKMGNGRGRIKVEVEHRRGKSWRVVVRDRAIGMSREELRERITRLGGRSSGFEAGLAVRGNLGRGAKDLVAFGPVEFKTIKDDRFSYLRLEPDGDYEICQRDHTATPAERDELGIPRGNGTVVTVLASPHHRCPQHENLAQQLQRHFQLRDIMADPKREVFLVNLNLPGDQRRLRYGLDESSIELEVDKELAINGYPDARPRLRLWRLPERCEQPRSDPARTCGVLVKGRRAIYENSLFNYENNPHAGWYRGRLECPYIDELADDYDNRAERKDAHPASNPLPIISRRREGLAPDHPFAKALTAAVDRVLAERVKLEEERERDSTGIENERTRRSLRRMAREAARFLLEAMREIEAEEPLLGAEGELPPIQIVPPEVILRLGEERTLSVIVRADAVSPDATVEIATDPEGVVEVLDGTSVALGSHRRREGVLVGQIHLRPLVEAETLLNASINGCEAPALITVQPANDEEPGEEAVLPEVLEFERARYRIGWTKRKRLTLRAPASLVAECGRVVRVTTDHDGVAVLKGGNVHLRVDEATGIALGTCQIEGRNLGTRATLRAELGQEIASTSVSVEQRDDGLPDLRIKPVSERPGLYRALFDPPEPQPGEPQTLKIYARHPSLARYLGDPPDYPGQDSMEWRAIQAEVVTEAIVRRIVSRKYPAGTQDVDAYQIYDEHFSYSNRLLPLMQREAAR